MTNQPTIAVLIDADNAALETLDKVLGKLDQRESSPCVARTATGSNPRSASGMRG
ncbi:NYN domain-containing protein [Tessaracoccus sp. HDW20]|uniref:hypothetical protein n=1 Tax=Tessaracoccus coleopterorum TaxID=2714950 RepID=UPI0018D2949E|nr:hypothetical protein [Tessaracoccus coleopterorum]NHB86101.1 NYN domain-containing protein [Tessaracoccus coleopterorum]